MNLLSVGPVSESCSSFACIVLMYALFCVRTNIFQRGLLMYHDLFLCPWRFIICVCVWICTLVPQHFWIWVVFLRNEMYRQCIYYPCSSVSWGRSVLPLSSWEWNESCLLKKIEWTLPCRILSIRSLLKNRLSDEKSCKLIISWKPSRWAHRCYQGKETFSEVKWLSRRF